MRRVLAQKPGNLLKRNGTYRLVEGVEMLRRERKKIKRSSMKSSEKKKWGGEK